MINPATFAFLTMETEDAVALAVAAMVALATGWICHRRPALASRIGARFQASTRYVRCYILAAALLPVLVRLSMLPWVNPPEPIVPDEFGHLLVADTLVNGRLANPPHPLSRHFETIYVLQHPSYASIYPIGNGIILAVGKILTGNPWAGVLLAVALMSGAISWVLFGCLPPVWAAGGGLFFAVWFGLAEDWVDSYWGGAFPAFGGALLFGALYRLKVQPSKTMAAVAGLGWTIVWLTRPFESLVPLLFFWGTIAIFVLRDSSRKRWLDPILVLLVIQASAGGVTALHNRAVTGSYTTLPYVLSQQIYGVPQGLIWQKPVEEPPLLVAEQRDTYAWQKEKAATPLVQRLRLRVTPIWEFFITPWYSLPIALCLLLFKDQRIAFIASLFAAAIATSALYPFFFPHYFAAYVCAISFLILRGLMMLSQWSFRGWVIGPVAVAFLLAGGLMERTQFSTTATADTFAKFGETGFQKRVASDFARIGGQHVMFVHYVAGHSFHDEWVYNGADIDSSQLVWCRWMGPAEDMEVAQYYKGRRFWVAEVGKGTVVISPYNLWPPNTPADHLMSLKR